MRKYKRLVRKYKRIFRRHARHVRPFDYRFGLDPFIDFLHFMRDYYAEGNNVHSKWEEDHDTDNDGRLDTLNEALAAFDAYEAMQFDQWIVTEGDFGKTYTYDVDVMKKYKQDKQALWDKFWTVVQDTIRDWWD